MGAAGHVLRQTVATLNLDEAPGDLVVGFPAEATSNTKLGGSFILPTKDASGGPFTGKGMTHLNVAVNPFGTDGLSPTNEMTGPQIAAAFPASVQVISVTPADGGTDKPWSADVAGPDGSVYEVAAWVDDD